MDISLHNKTALVCGSTQGIGLASAIELALLGANCVLFARNEASLQKEVHQLPVTDGQQHQYLVADFDNPAEVKSVVESFLSNNYIHILINNSGGPKGGPITEAAEDEFTNTFSRHVICYQILTKAVIPGMKAAGYGRIINIISTSVKIPLANLGVSNTIRAAVAGWAKTMANELGQFGITVNNVLPGFTDTGRLQSIIKDNASKNNITIEQVAANMKKDIPAQRFGEASEIAAVVAFLASLAAGYVNGTSIPVDGGRTGSI